MTKKITDKITDKKIKEVTRTGEASQIERTEAVGSVTGVKATESVREVSSTSRISASRQPTRAISAEEREKLLALINEEAEKMMQEGGLPQSTKEIAKDAVMMAVDAGLVVEDDPTGTKRGTGKGK